MTTMHTVLVIVFILIAIFLVIPKMIRNIVDYERKNRD